MKTLFPAVLTAASADWAPALEAAARTVAALAVAAFVAGEQLGRFVHQFNDGLAAAYRCLLVGHQKAAAVVQATWQGLPLTSLNVIELRRVARERGLKTVGDRRIAQARRAALLAALA